MNPDLSRRRAEGVGGVGFPPGSQYQGSRDVDATIGHQYLCTTLLPNLANTVCIEFPLTTLIENACQADPSFQRLDPIAVGDLIQAYQTSQHAQFSFGGWMENRAAVWQGTYLDQDERYIHLGLDINASVGTPVRFPAAAIVLNVMTSPDTDIGWGTRIDLKHPQLPWVLIIGHLNPDVQVATDSLIGPQGQTLGSVGSISVNGNVFPHIHLQAMDYDTYRQFPNPAEVDGYGPVSELDTLQKSYPWPLEVLSHFLTPEEGLK